jgi:pyruvate kinase
MAHAAVALARDLKLLAIVIPTTQGTTVRVMASHRAMAPMVGVCSSKTICRRLALHWGVIPVLVESTTSKNWRALCHRIEPQTHLTIKDSEILLISGFNDDPNKNAPVLKVLRL